MSLHAEVLVPARDRGRLERLCRYAARPPLAIERLEATLDGRPTYRLRTPWRDGTTHVLMERHQLLERLAPLIPPPRAHQVRYHGVLAPCASGRDWVVPREAEHKGSVGVAANAAEPRKAGSLAAITDPDVARRILMCLRLPPRAPPFAPAVSPRPVVDSWIDAPEFGDFDQTVAEDWDSGA